MNRKKVRQKLVEKLERAMEEAYEEMAPGDDSTPKEQQEFEDEFPTITADVLRSLVDQVEEHL